MKRKIELVLLLSLLSFILNAQNKRITGETVKPSVVKKAVSFGLSKPIVEMPRSQGPRTEAEQKAFKKLKRKKENRLNVDLVQRQYPFKANALPKTNDPVWQKQNGTAKYNKTRSLELNISGQQTPYSVSDCIGDVGENHFMQGVNTTFAIWDKSGNQVVAPTDFNTLFEGVLGASRNDGDPIVLYDEQAERWLAVEFSLGGYYNDNNDNDFMLIAVSQTSDPTGAWYRWSFDVADLPDYEKLGVWRDGYYMATNNPAGDDIYVFDRTAMLSGAADVTMIGFDNPNRPQSGFHCLEPLDNDGAWAPAGTPGQFITINDDAWSGSEDEIWIYELNANWSNPNNSTFSRVKRIPVAPFDSDFGSGQENITQKGTSNKVDAIPQILMYRAQYRNFGDKEIIVCAHTVDVDDTDHAGIRWYELENTDLGWKIRQQSTYAPDAHSRWLPSISINADKTIALGYTVSSETLYPSIRYCGQSSAENALGTSVLDFPEEEIYAGTRSLISSDRWGDYCAMAVDPADGTTFWFTTEFARNSNAKGTKIASFQYPMIEVPQKDIKVFNVLSPSNSMSLTANEPLKIKLINSGLETITSFDIAYKLNGGEEVRETVNHTLQSAETMEYTFSSNLDLSEVGAYNIQIITYLEGDTKLDNNIFDLEVSHLEKTYCMAASESNTYEYIKKVKMGVLNNTSQSSKYTDYTYLTAEFSQGDTIHLTVVPGSFFSDKCKVWIDWNQDKEFDELTEKFEMLYTQSVFKVDIKVPTDAPLGMTRMRIRLYDPNANSSGYSDEACGVCKYGEVEDYTLNILSNNGGSGINGNDAQNDPTFTFNNPVDQLLNIHFQTNKKMNKIELIDEKGVVLWSENDLTSSILKLNTAPYPTGTYLLRVTSKAGETLSKKLIIRH